MVKLAYITSAVVPTNDAQSIQIQAMAQAFFNTLGNNFIFISPQNATNKNFSTPFTWHRLSQPFGNWRAGRYLFTALASRNIIRRGAFTHIYTRDIGIAALYIFLGNHVTYEIHKPFNTVLGRILFSLLHRRLKIIAISQNLKDFVVKEYGVAFKQVLVAHDGVWLENFSPLTPNAKQALKEKLFGVPASSTVALYSGSMQPGKGVEIVTALAASIKEVEFVILGGSSAKHEGNMRIINRQPPNVVVEYLQAADVLLLPNTPALPYHHFTSPLKLFEYMASGTPIIASRLGSITEVLNDQNALLCAPGDTASWTQAIQTVRSNKELAAQKAAAAKHDVQKYSWQNRVAAIIKYISTPGSTI